MIDIDVLGVPNVGIDDRCEDVNAEGYAETTENGWREEPGRDEGMALVERSAVAE